MPPYEDREKTRYGGTARMLSEPHHRGMTFGLALHSVDDWVQALPAGGPSRTRTLDRPVMSREL